MEFIENYPVENLKSADYNPRQINKEALESLKESISKFGIIKPLIINGDNTLTAGHQRLKALKDLKIKDVPIIKLKNINKADEIMFNLFHNSIETSSSKVSISLINQLKVGYNFVEPKFVNIRFNKNPIIVKEISKLLIKYDTWGV